MNYLHGVETIDITDGRRIINTVKTGVMGLVGIAPAGAVNEMKVITNPRDAVTQFGKKVPGFTIPTALDAFFTQGGSVAIVVNVFDDSTMVAAVSDESLTITGGKAVLSAAPIGAVVLTSADGNTTYVQGTDYEVDAFGNLTVLDLGTIAEASQPLASFDKLDFAQVAAADIVGEVSGDTRTGFKLFSLAKSQFGYAPKILVSPVHCETVGVATEMIAQANALEAIAIIDGQSVESSSDTVSDVIAERGVSGTYAGFQTNSSRAMLVWPYLKVFDTVTNAVVNRSPSPYIAGAMSAKDNSAGYWFSPSNTVLQGVQGVEIDITNQLDDVSAQTNQLNSAGIVTFLKGYGTGTRIWGNFSAARPSSTEPTRFVAVQRVRDILNESVRDSMLPFIDQPINNALIDSITETVNGFIRTLIQRGAIVDGRCEYDTDSNPVENIAAGQLTFRITFMPPTPAERITFESFIDISLLETIKNNAAQVQ